MDASQTAQRMVVLVLRQARVVHQFVLQVPFGKMGNQRMAPDVNSMAA